MLRKPISVTLGNAKFHIGHGDGLGPKDHTYKVLKKVFANPVSQWLFARVHPNTGIGLANFWSRRSRISNTKEEEIFKGDDEWLITFCKETQQVKHHDFYVFGHRHLPLDIPIGDNSRYINLGEWVNYCSYAEYDGNDVQIRYCEPEK